MAKKRGKTPQPLDPAEEAAFLEVEAALREEQRNRILRRIAPWIGGGAVAIIITVAGYTWYTSAEDRAAMRSANLYLELITTAPVLAQQNDTGKASANPRFTELSQQATAQSTPGYQVISELAIAAGLVEQSDFTAATNQLLQVARNDGNVGALGKVAIIKAGLAALNAGDQLGDDLKNALIDLASSDSAMRLKAQEILALDAYRAGDLQQARRYYAAVATGDNSSPNQSYRSRQSLRLLNSALPSPRDNGDGTN